MESAPLTDEVALRIGLASRCLPGVSVAELMRVLEAQLGDQIDEAGLTGITVTHLKSAFKKSHDLDEMDDAEADTRLSDMEAFKEAVQILWGEHPYASSVPEVQAYSPGDMPRSVRVAVASNSAEMVNGHFGSCSRFLIYQVSADEVRLIAVRSALPPEGVSDKNSFRVGLILDCRIVYLQHIGGPAMAKVIKSDIHLSTVKEGGPARDVLARLQQVLAGAPPPWLRKALAASHDA